MRIKLLSAMLFFSITACSTNNSEINKTNNNSVTCNNPRPEMCTMDYRPVCGLMAENQVKTYSNACTACSDEKVSSYTVQACKIIN